MVSFGELSNNSYKYIHLAQILQKGLNILLIIIGQKFSMEIKQG